jgi:hypothetical protein
MLEKCCKNALKYNHKNIDFFVVGDKKTPKAVAKYCQKLTSTYKFPVHYLDIKDQEDLLKKYPKLLKLVPYNDACRKLYGLVIAYIKGFDTLIMLDDDNHPTEHDFFGRHGIVGQTPELSLIESPSGWFNTCEYLIEENNVPFYYRGFPWSQRKIKKDPIKIHKTRFKVTVNSGFWLEDPDVDATTRLYWPVRAVGMKKEMEPSFGLYPGTWCPFNNQNTAMAREVLPGYYTPYTALRFSDLYPAYVICRIAEQLKHIVSFGHPFVKQWRNPHNLWNDVKLEIVGAQSAEILIELLRSAKLSGDTYHKCLGELNKHFSKNIDVVKNLPENQSEMLMSFINDLNTYHEVFEAINKDIKK